MMSYKVEASEYVEDLRSSKRRGSCYICKLRPDCPMSGERTRSLVVATFARVTLSVRKVACSMCNKSASLTPNSRPKASAWMADETGGEMAEILSLEQGLSPAICKKIPRPAGMGWPFCPGDHAASEKSGVWENDRTWDTREVLDCGI